MARSEASGRLEIQVQLTPSAPLKCSIVRVPVQLVKMPCTRVTNMWSRSPGRPPPDMPLPLSQKTVGAHQVELDASGLARSRSGLSPVAGSLPWTTPMYFQLSPSFD